MDMRDHTPPSSDHPMAQFYQQNFSGQPMPPSGRPTFNNATLLPTHGSSVAPSNTTITNTVHQMSPEGRVSKPVRRRSRASRRTPTTLLNTDTTNFRAMVQQFTGGPVLPQFGSNSAAAGGAAHSYQLMRFQQQEQANYLYGGDRGLLGGGGGANVEMNLAGGGGGGVSVVEAPPAPPNRQGATNGNRDVNNSNNNNRNNYMF